MYGHVHIRAVPEPPPTPAVGIVTTSLATPPFITFVAPGSGGDPAPIDIDFYVVSDSDAACTIKVRTANGNYTAGDDFTAVDQTITLPGTDDYPGVPGQKCVKVSVTITNASPGISLPYEAANASFSLELYDPTGCDIGGEVEIDGDTYDLLDVLAACGTGI